MIKFSDSYMSYEMDISLIISVFNQIPDGKTSAVLLFLSHQQKSAYTLSTDDSGHIFKMFKFPNNKNLIRNEVNRIELADNFPIDMLTHFPL